VYKGHTVFGGLAGACCSVGRDSALGDEEGEVVLRYGVWQRWSSIIGYPITRADRRLQNRHRGNRRYPPFDDVTQTEGSTVQPIEEGRLWSLPFSIGVSP
jgi:hypothetical protein